MKHCIKLNLARNCIKYIIRTYGINEIFVPYYICETVWQAIKQEKCKIKFYHIDKNFMPADETLLKPDDFILYVNYFGLLNKNCKTLSKKYKNLIIDNTQSFYSKPLGLASFNSLRKFHPVTNGAYLYTKNTLPQEFEIDDLELENTLIHRNYNLFIKNELCLNKETSIKLINPNIEKKLSKINFESDKNIRVETFKKYEQILSKYNRLNLKLEADSIPYCYPFIPKDEASKTRIINNKITLLQLWKNFPQNTPEAEIVNDLAALPLTDIDYSNKIINLFK